MSQQTDLLKIHANQIKNEVADGANTASRVGGAILEAANLIETHDTQVKEHGDRLNDLGLEIEKVDSKLEGYVEIEEEGFVIADKAKRIAVMYNKKGFDVAELSQHFKSLIKNIEGFGNDLSVETIEKGFFLADSNNRIGLSYGKEGLDAAKISKHFKGLLFDEGEGVYYEGEKLRINSNRYKINSLGAYSSELGTSYQGICIYKNYIVSLLNSGYANILSIDENGVRKVSPTFSLASFASTNHCNVADFGVDKYDQNDVLPPVYVSQAYNGTVDGKKDVCYVERISLEGSSQLIQTISFNDVNRICGYALQWCIDKQNRLLVGYANTINNTDARNKHRVLGFKLPDLSLSNVELTENDLVFNYLIEDFSNCNMVGVIGQGLHIKNGALFMPTGYGTTAKPSVLYVWDIYAKTMLNVINLQGEIAEELEDCDIWNDSLVFQTNKGKFYSLNNI